MTSIPTPEPDRNDADMPKRHVQGTSRRDSGDEVDAPANAERAPGLDESQESGGEAHGRADAETEKGEGAADARPIAHREREEDDG